MPELTRRRSTDAREECWHVYYGDVLAGTIAIGSGNPHDEDPWEWHCGFYPGSHPGEHQDGTAASFDEAAPISKPRGSFFWRSEPRLMFRRGVASKIGSLESMSMWQAGEKLPSQKPSTLAYAARIYAMASKINIDSRTLVTRR